MEIINEKFDIDKIVDYLQVHKSKLRELYDWKISIEKLKELDILNDLEIEDLNKSISAFEKELKIKHIINLKLNQFVNINDNLFYETCFWIIKDWGGIRGGKQDNLKSGISSFLKDDKVLFDRISSISKVCAFMQPHKYIIYDSRVIYSLNWIILSKNAGSKFFPMPETQNTRLKAFDINTLIRLERVNEYKICGESKNMKLISSGDKKVYIEKQNAYKELNNLIKEVHYKLWSNENPNKLYLTEMLLFSLADKEIYKEITNSISIKFE